MLKNSPAPTATAPRTDLDVARARIVQLERAVESHGVIGQAMGILMCRYSINADAAFAALIRASQGHNLKLRCLADAVIDTTTGRDVAIPRELTKALEEILRTGERARPRPEREQQRLPSAEPRSETSEVRP
jgi:hypothetical protein